MFSIPVSSQSDLISALDFVIEYYALPMLPVELFVVIKLCLCHCCPDGYVVEVKFEDKESPSPKVGFKVVPSRIPLFPSENRYLCARVDDSTIKGLADFEYRKSI